MKLFPHILVTIMYVIILIVVCANLSWNDISPNSMGDFLAGAFSPLAFYWFVITAFLQRAELKATRDQFERQATASETQAETQKRRDQREAIKSVRKDIDEAIESIPLRIFRLSNEIKKFELRRYGKSGEQIPQKLLEQLQPQFLCPPMPDDSVQEARAYAYNLRSSLTAWNKSKINSIGSVGECLFAFDHEKSEWLKLNWKKLLDWHLIQYQRAERIDDLSFSKAALSSGLEDIRYAYFQAFPEKEFYLWNVRDESANPPI